MSKYKSVAFILLGLLVWSFVRPSLVKEISSKLIRYYQDNIPLKIYLSNNQPVYSPGDTIYLSGHLLTAHELSPIAGRQVIQLELTDQHGNVPVSLKALAKDGRFSNQLIIPDNLSAGMYVLVAYNNWMRNQGVEFYFKKHIPITKDSKIVPTQEIPKWHFYPEGGNFINGLNQRVVVRGRPDTPVIIRSSGNELIADFITNKSGYGSFFIKPSLRLNYLLHAQGEPEPVPLPQAANDGLAIQLLHTQERIDVILQTAERSEFNNDKLLFVLSSHNNLISTAELQFKRQRSAIVQLNKSDLPDGVLLISILDSKGEPIAERMFYQYQQTLQVKTQTSKEIYHTREKAELTINITEGPELIPLTGIFSITVFRKDLFPNSYDNQNIVSNLLLFSDVPDAFKSESTEKGGNLESNQIDNYLISQKWQRFSWQDLLSKERRNEHLFKTHLDVTGEILDLGSSRVKYDSLLVSCYLQNNQDVYEVYSDEEGRFNAAFLFDVWDEEEIFVMAYRKPDTYRNVKLKYEKTYTSGIKAKDSQVIQEPDIYAMFSEKRKKINQSYQFNDYFDAGKVESKQNPHARIEAEIKGFDFEVDFSKYYIFPTMEETIREIVPWLMHRKVNKENTLKLYLKDLNMVSIGEPVLIIDGIMTNNTDYFLSLKPSDVLRIKLINTTVKMEHFGIIGNNGLVVVETRIPDHASSIPRTDNIILTEGFSRELPFINVNHAVNVSSRIPDVRSTLFWSPWEKTNQQAEAKLMFYTSDDSGIYAIQIEGITHDGRPFYAESEFEVKHKPK